jgi:methylenetetrahydrofolate reductase (NADPH)
VQTGDQPGAKPVFDLDSISLLRTARTLRDEGHFLSGRQLDSKPRFFLGGAANPFVPPYEYRPQRLAKKVAAGADFIQTQYCFDIPRLETFMDAVRQAGLHEQVYILVGVGPLRSARAAEWMRTNVPGVIIPDAVIERLRGAGKGQQQAEGRKICVEIIQQVREIEGVAGVHVMAYRQEELVAEIIEEAGLLPRRWQPGRGRILPSEEASN